jgi:hypothetical protein
LKPTLAKDKKSITITVLTAASATTTAGTWTPDFTFGQTTVSAPLVINARVETARDGQQY